MFIFPLIQILKKPKFWGHFPVPVPYSILLELGSLQKTSGSSVADPGWFIPDPTIAPSRIRGGKKAPDPGSYCT
jgi:hypothetical protein